MEGTKLAKEYAESYYKSNRIMDPDDHFMNGFLAGIKALRKVSYKIRQGNQVTGFDYPGLFHGWGISMEDSGNQLASYTQGIIELQDGSIIMVYPDYIKFD